MPANVIRIEESVFTTRISMLAESFEEAGDTASAKKLKDLTQRAQSDNGSAYAAFVGLFSAGKSSLLNTLCGSELETGAVPTTAHATRVILPDTDNHVVLMDTPGVDSTDDAHQEATEKALHLADAVVLVMDYQHVEADENLELAQQFDEGNKRLAIVVNQIDKHLDFELSFETFRQRVLTALEDWGIEYERLFFTANTDTPYNQLPELRQWLHELASNETYTDASEEPETERLHDKDLADGAFSRGGVSILLRVEEVVDEHVDWLFQEEWEQKSQNATHMVGFELESVEEITEQYWETKRHVEEMGQRLDAAEQQLQQVHGDISEKIMRSIDSAQIAPYETTEKGKAFIASIKPEFRVGWFRKEEKTEQERQNRLRSFMEDIHAKSTQFLLWPTQSELRQLLLQQEWLFPETEDEISAMQLSVTEDLCRKLVQEGALVSDSYGHQYVADVSAAIRGQCSRQVKRILEAVKRTAQALQSEKLSDQKNAREKLKETVAALGELLRLKEDIDYEKEKYMGFVLRNVDTVVKGEI